MPEDILADARFSRHAVQVLFDWSMVAGMEAGHE
jgi:hypothetical protein